jgi:hypothetical protein
MPENLASLLRIRSVVRSAVLLSVVLLAASSFVRAPQDQSSDPRLQKAYRFEQDGWIYVHLKGSPSDIGFQHGYLLAPEIH